ncbi:uncharacterized protein Rexo5 isoform X1 [Panulirus ornatus]|uniref:uncharacterized protein Rexo5 isoform X1 n=1 Tax=Panulirus ornatus TaxID=150431 RepID=UPI003A860626
MSETISERKMIRLENKKRKLQAYIEIAESNNEDRKRMRETARGTENKFNTESQLTVKSLVGNGAAETFPKQYYRLSREYAEVLKKKKELDRIKKAWPRIFLNSTGQISNLVLAPDERCPLFMSDIQSLILSSLLHNRSPSLPRWARLLHTRKYSHVVTVIIEGIGISDLTNEADSSEVVQKGVGPAEDTISENCTTDELQAKLKTNHIRTLHCDQKVGNADTKRPVRGGQPDWLLKTFPKTCPLMNFKLEVLAPSNYDMAPFKDILSVPLSKSAEIRITKKFNSLSEAERNGLIYRAFDSFASAFPMVSRSVDRQKKCRTKNVAISQEDGTPLRLHLSDSFDRRSLLLSPQDMWEFRFPSPILGCPGYDDPEFKFTHEKFAEVKATSPMFAVDCEMCITCIFQLEITSVSVVNEKMELVYHTLVKPVNRIVNYLTKFSGITERKLKDVTTRLEDVQRDLRELLPPDAILVGHSLDSDLKALKLMHPYVIDSSLVFNLTHVRRIRSSLKHLAKMFLGEDIQNGQDGHDPTEDAGASLKLIQLKLRNDITFGDVIHGGKFPNKQGEQAFIKEQVQDYKKEKALVRTVEGYFTNLLEHVGSLNTAVLSTSSCVGSYDCMLSGTLKKLSHFEILPSNKQVSVRTREVSIHKDFTCVHLKMDAKLGQCQTPESRQHCFKKLDKQLHRIYDGASQKALIIFIFGGSSLDVPADQCSNGLVMLAIKGQPFKV